MPAPAADKQEQIKEDCKRIADLFKAIATAMFEGQDGLILHLEFDDPAKLGKFTEYLRAHGSRRVERIQTRSDQVHEYLGQGASLEVVFLDLLRKTTRLTDSLLLLGRSLGSFRVATEGDQGFSIAALL